MTPEDLLRQATEALNGDPELARRNQQMRALLEHAQTIADIVNAYKVGCMPTSAPPRQVAETEQAMYVGCHMLLQMFLRKASQGGIEGQQWMDAVLQECNEYASARFTMVRGANQDGALIRNYQL
jgi:hypothetical protein